MVIPLPSLCCPKAIFSQLWMYTWGVHYPFGRPICTKALNFMPWDVLKMLFCEVRWFLLQQSTPTTWCCHPSRLGWCSLARKASPFFSIYNNGHYCQTVPFMLQQTRKFLQKVRSLSPCAFANRALPFFMSFLEQWPFPCWAACLVISI